MQTLLAVEGIIILIFCLFKLKRSSLLESCTSDYAQITLYSFPNFIEGIVGVCTITLLGLYIRNTLNISHKTLYIAATVLAAIYVLTQEFKWHHLGGNNTYDPYDVLFSVFGLAVGYTIVHILQPQRP